ncbi:MAG: helix-turn-helix domain-containing protein [Sphingomonas sp.]
MTTDPPAIQPPLGQVVRYCPATRAAALIGDAWTQLILREAFAGTRRYSDFLSRLGISRAVLADRLRRLARNGVIASSPPSHGGARVEYVLTEMGRDAIGIILIQDAWDLEFGASGVGSRVTTYRHEAHGRSLAPVVLDGRHGSPIEMRRLNYPCWACSAMG